MNKTFIAFILALSLLGSSFTQAENQSDEIKQKILNKFFERLQGNDHLELLDSKFSMLVLGDSQMAGYGWEGGYANCIKAVYSKANIINIAQSGSRLTKGEIHEQLELALTSGVPAPDFVLLDGGANDMPYLKREEFKDTGTAIVGEALNSLIEAIHSAFPDTHIIYVIMPPFVEWDDSENGPPAYEIQERFWKEMHMTANQYDYVTVVDLFSINPFRFPCAGCYQENFADSIHFNEAGYRKTYSFIDNVLLARLSGIMSK